MTAKSKKKPRNHPAHFFGGPFDGLTKLLIPRLPGGLMESYNAIDTLVATTRGGVDHVYHANDAKVPWVFVWRGRLTGKIPAGARVLK